MPPVLFQGTQHQELLLTLPPPLLQVPHLVLSTMGVGILLVR